MALLNKQGLHKYTDNNLKLHKQSAFHWLSRKARLETTHDALITLARPS